MQGQANVPHRDPASGSTRFGNRRGRILVVEDDNSVREISRKALVDSGYDVDTAEDGAAAWQAINVDVYDLVITDNNMPKLSGLELLELLHGARMRLPVIMATGALPDEEFRRRPWLQPDASLLKPYTMEDMVSTVKKVLGAAQDGARTPWES